MCSRMLSLPLEKVIHILHFMIYAKLASKPYVANLIILAKQKKKNVVKDNNRDQEDTIYSSAKDSRHFTVFMESNQIEIDLFRKELKKELNSPGESKKTGKKTDNKRYFNLKNVYPDEEELFDENQNPGEEPILKTGASTLVNIPSKVGSFDNSSVITRLKYSSSRPDVGSHSIKKLQMRRQKFNEDFDCLKKYEILDNNRRESKKNDWSAGNGVGEDAKKSINGVFRQQKHPYEYFSQMASTIRSKNKQLDSIRFECASRTFKRNALRENEWNRQEKAGKAKITSFSAN